MIFVNLCVNRRLLHPSVQPPLQTCLHIIHCLKDLRARNAKQVELSRYLVEGLRNNILFYFTNGQFSGTEPQLRMKRRKDAQNIFSLSLIYYIKSFVYTILIQWNSSCCVIIPCYIVSQFSGTWYKANIQSKNVQGKVSLDTYCLAQTFIKVNYYRGQINIKLQKIRNQYNFNSLTVGLTAENQQLGQHHHNQAYHRFSVRFPCQPATASMSSHAVFSSLHAQMMEILL